MFHLSQQTILMNRLPIVADSAVYLMTYYLSFFESQFFFERLTGFIIEKKKCGIFVRSVFHLGALPLPREIFYGRERDLLYIRVKVLNIK